MLVKNYGIDNLIDRSFHLAVILLIYNSVLKILSPVKNEAIIINKMGAQHSKA